jgi:hypothetical protein
MSFDNGKYLLKFSFFLYFMDNVRASFPSQRVLVLMENYNANLFQGWEWRGIP